MSTRNSERSHVLGAAVLTAHSIRCDEISMLVAAARSAMMPWLALLKAFLLLSLICCRYNYFSWPSFLADATDIFAGEICEYIRVDIDSYRTAILEIPSYLRVLPAAEEGRRRWKACNGQISAIAHEILISDTSEHQGGLQPRLQNSTFSDFRLYSVLKLRSHRRWKVKGIQRTLSCREMKLKVSGYSQCILITQ
jgi:hypothetical protein